MIASPRTIVRVALFFSILFIVIIRWPLFIRPLQGWIACSVIAALCNNEMAGLEFLCYLLSSSSHCLKRGLLLILLPS